MGRTCSCRIVILGGSRIWLHVRCIKGSDGAVIVDGAWTAGMVSAMINWSSWFSVHQSR